ncbi:hypothetical protein MNQ95_04030 [Pseudoxanthomonas daejeonensis]|uniref:hypothetical protein n=1 Tax=Pseudoxanthomonas daejeonensis TaxID=266062 RepID=UPI001F5423EA|nr:hypothetical protein [Pseudoxanthomonas daejeonensis]UNK58280.1 hypothetical protein MNQ95_04030 [Pseudoxanthomonas daejeonensis]
MHVSVIPAASALVLALSACLPAHAQATQAELYIDVATHAMPGMPGMGAIGRLAGAMGGETASYGQARHPGMPGKYLDVALHNRRQPGTPADQAVPGGLGVGPSIRLLAPATSGSTPDATPAMGNATQQDGSFRVRYYWGCGDQVRSGQPAEFTVTVRNGRPVTGGRAMQPRTIPAHGPKAAPPYVLWPNTSTRKAVGPKASLVGAHQLAGDALPESMRFVLDSGHDFLPELKVRSEGGAGQGTLLRWDGVDGARAYFAHALASDGDTIVMWSSSEDGYAGPELVDYLPDSLVTQWTGKRTLMKPDTRECRIPDAVFANAGGNGPMLQMIAYGSERSIAEPRPDGAAREWKPAWNVRVRTKSTAMLMPGLGAIGADAARDAAKPAARDKAGNEVKEEVKDAAKSLLRGLIRR